MPLSKNQENFHVKPYNETDGKKSQVEAMFDNIAPKYDFLNHLLSLNIDKRWRKKAINLLKPSNPQHILDIATGTGDLAIALEKQLKPRQIIGVDLSEGMISFGRIKIFKLGLRKTITLEKGDSESLRFADATFDAATCAFGVRNFENLHKGLSEIKRVLKPNAKFVILEFSMPTNFIVKNIYLTYFQYILPFLGKLFSRDKSAYSYLPESVKNFPYGENMLKIMTEVGFRNSEFKPLMFGIATIYNGLA
jgi:demethylmenaquinone methyltransferase/2-methoxy-6-polyprenyl-1,4-benzoquinol methylase